MQDATVRVRYSKRRCGRGWTNQVALDEVEVGQNPDFDDASAMVSSNDYQSTKFYAIRCIIGLMPTERTLWFLMGLLP
jgi:hypothetical protein